MEQWRIEDNTWRKEPLASLEEIFQGVGLAPFIKNEIKTGGNEKLYLVFSAEEVTAIEQIAGKFLPKKSSALAENFLHFCIVGFIRHGWAGPISATYVPEDASIPISENKQFHLAISIG